MEPSSKFCSLCVHKVSGGRNNSLLSTCFRKSPTFRMIYNSKSITFFCKCTVKVFAHLFPNASVLEGDPWESFGAMHVHTDTSCPIPIEVGI